MKNVISISLGAKSQDFDFKTRFMGVDMRVRRRGTDGSMAEALKLARYWDKRASAIGLGLVKESGHIGAHRAVEQDGAKLQAVARSVPVTTGASGLARSSVL